MLPETVKLAVPAAAAQVVLLQRLAQAVQQALAAKVTMVVSVVLVQLP
jgi:hypothetical protein